ncbi:tRNA N(3)-methylcytidine methyltransferase METTL2-like isoform X2 [Xenia sp. Carnegie-2017]|uniref:tRNA N(3)-methylcytidine methyltransferase METTL2-like isoform X2 n=1 Tax=Xenia sp. Carnegie-2017 TaxID=2897299 RepID=UPI001F040541|nr:tRNA N(3)-methylcytidine methyltransferase METTL2-like isoform X2 [Xenia sp. Carnegie-2017]
MVPDLFTTMDDKERPQFGNRFLNDNSKVFEHNAWDNVKWSKEQEESAIKVVQENSTTYVPAHLQEMYTNNAHDYWNNFYMQHNNRFFKDRHWLFTEFPELAAKSTLMSKRSLQPCDDGQAGHYPGSTAKMKILEVGCGAGNTLFPILQNNNDCELFIYCCDFASVAVDLVKDQEEYKNGRCYAFVCDITKENDFPFPPESLDIILLVFVLSAISPLKFQQTVERLTKYLKPGGYVFFRDYGRYDMAQLRFKKGKCLADNFYVRGDGTRCYFFTQDEIRTLFTKEGLVEEQNYVDRRLQVNRGRQIKMYRIWLQAKYKKPNH